MSGSEQSSEEQWDDMAIVRAFEDALTDQRTRNTSTAAKVASRKHKAKANGKRPVKSISTDEEEGEQGEFEPATASAESGAAWGQNAHQSNAGAFRTFAAAANPFANQQQSSNELCQAAYAQAYAHLQAQFQAAYPGPQSVPQHAAAPQQPYGGQMPMFPAQPLYHSPPGFAAPSVPPMQTPFPAMPGASPFPGPVPNSSDDGLANLLLSWYQSGYYTGRFQAMQEMKLQGRR
ncbi:hypothetical protein BBP00_00006503 [Phytophthora kernoviae]|uniref:Survival motor neuron Tudor domain-containing protein n=1 Tax=Phytophthora kernoviae TaxID=325452 RepID=A0A3F2RKU5_9STRA|nr:hypothetical protein BBP00_00006503 [Phytophthora kernoviae]